MKAVIIAEDFAGMRAQGIGLAEKAGFDHEFRPVRCAAPWSHIPARLWPAPLRRIEPVTLPGDTDLLISLGGTGGVVGAALARAHGLPVVQVQDPRIAVDRFDLVIACTHDGLCGDNVLVSRNALHPVTPETLAAARRRWSADLKPDGRPLLSILTGGANGRFAFGPREAQRLASDVLAFMACHDHRVVLTPSRRTGSKALRVLQECLTPAGVRIETGTGDANPYLGMLACADMIAVTTDSVSMISEASATHAPVAIIPLPGRSARIGRFIATMEKAGRIRPFRNDMTPWPVTPLDDTPVVAREMRHRLKL